MVNTWDRADPVTRDMAFRMNSFFPKDKLPENKEAKSVKEGILNLTSDNKL